MFPAFNLSAPHHLKDLHNAESVN